VARDRQRAKQRQAERRARRLAEQGRGDGTPKQQAAAAEPAAAEPAPAEPAAAEPAPAEPALPEVEDPRAAEPAPGVDPSLAVGAPPEEEGRSDTVYELEPDLGDEDEHLTEEEIEAEESAELEREAAGEPGFEVRGHRGPEHPEEHKKRSRVVQFLIAVWAELQRVQWPDRQALTTLTGVVLGFVLIAGGYLGLLDAIFSELIQSIL
jgi:preprotein translocase subunit SecE